MDKPLSIKFEQHSTGAITVTSLVRMQHVSGETRIAEMIESVPAEYIAEIMPQMLESFMESVAK